MKLHVTPVAINDTSVFFDKKVGFDSFFIVITLGSNLINKVFRAQTSSRSTNFALAPDGRTRQKKAGKTGPMR